MRLKDSLSFRKSRVAATAHSPAVERRQRVARCGKRRVNVPKTGQAPLGATQICILLPTA